jgi:hypothetical protein
MLDYLIDHPETVGIDMELPLWASQVEFYTILQIRDVYLRSQILILYHKIENYFILELVKKILPIDKKLLYLFAQKIVTKLSKLWVWGPGSEIQYPWSRKNLFRIPDSGV